jgi:hypothetical protein
MFCFGFNRISKLQVCRLPSCVLRPLLSESLRYPSWAVQRRLCQNYGTRRSLPDPNREHRYGGAQAISYLIRICTRAVNSLNCCD